MDVPSGTVVLWMGSAESIPTGWAKYSATVGRFIRGVPAGQSVGATGGNASTHVHTMGTALTGGSHTHGEKSFTSTSGGNLVSRDVGQTVPASASHTHTGKVSLGSGGAHVHNPASANTGTPIGETNPPYVKGIYIIKGDTA